MAPDLEWLGDRVVANVLGAAEDSSRAIVGDAAAEARVNTPVLTGEAREKLQPFGEGLNVGFGYVNLLDEQGNDRGLYIEVGANGKPGHYAVRRAADANFPRLPGRIRRELSA